MKQAMWGWALAVSTGLTATWMPAIAGTDFIHQDGFESFPEFAIQTPGIVVAPGESTTYCYYFRAPIANTIGVNRWSSVMTPGTHHLVAYAAYDSNWVPLERQPPGTLTTSSCGLDQGGDIATWLYRAHHATEELVVPADDGSGQPLGMEIQSGQPLFVQIYVLNLTDTPLTATALLRAQGLAPGDAYTNTATYLTINNSFMIAPNGVGTVVQQTCPTPVGAKFWWLSTRTHRYAMSSRILDGNSPLVVSSNWEDPLAVTYTPPSFHSFASGGLTYECTYNNTNGFVLHPGESEDTDEVCLGIGYFFPAAHPTICVDNSGPL